MSTSTLAVSAASATDTSAVDAAALDAAAAAIGWANASERTRHLGTVVVPWDQWYGVPAHPAQRNTAIHAAKLTASDILSEPIAIHLKVAAVAIGDTAEMQSFFNKDSLAFLQLPNVVKLDGHSRTAAQDAGKAPKPSAVIVDVYAAKDAASSLALYKAFDSAASTKGQKDGMQSVLRLAGIQPTSAIMQQGKIGNALRVASAIVEEGGITVRPMKGKKLLRGEEMTIDRALEALLPQLEFARHWKDEIEMIDSVDIDGKVMAVNAPALAAYLAILRADPVKGEEFLRGIRRGEGISDASIADPIFIARTAPDHLKLKRGKLKGHDRNETIIAIILNAWKGYLSNETFDATKYPVSKSVIASMFEAERKAAAKAAQAAEKAALSSEVAESAVSAEQQVAAAV